MTASTVINAGLLLTVLFAALAAARMRVSGLYTRYRLLFMYLIYLVPGGVWPLLLSPRSHAYFWFWIYTEPINWLFDILVVRELCGLVLERYRGLCSLGRWAMYGGMGLSAAISLASLLPRLSNTLTSRSQLLAVTVGMNRGVNFALALFLLLMLLLVSRYPMPISRNVILNAVLFTIVFFCNTLAMLLHTVFDLSTGMHVDAVLTSLNALTLLVWFLALTPRGELPQIETRQGKSEHEAHLLAHLERLNAMVLRLAES